MSSASSTNQEQTHFLLEEKMENKEKVLQKAKNIFKNLKTYKNQKIYLKI